VHPCNSKHSSDRSSKGKISIYKNLIHVNQLLLHRSNNKRMRRALKAILMLPIMSLVITYRKRRQSKRESSQVVRSGQMRK